MPLEPVTAYDGAHYPTLEEMAPRRRDFLRCVGLAAIGAAFGPHVLGCSDERSGPLRPLAGAPVPPRWPGPRAAIVGGGPVQVTYADGRKGWVVVAAVFDPSNQQLEAALIDAAKRIVAVVGERLGRERSGFRADTRRLGVAESDLLQSIRGIVAVAGLDSVALAEVDAEAAARPARPVAPPTLPPPRAQPAPLPAPREEPIPAMQPVRRLPRAGAKCPLHPNGCLRSDAGGP